MKKIISGGMWTLMFLLAVGVAGYATTLVLNPAIAPPFLQEGLANGDLRYYFHFLGGSIALVFGALQFNGFLRKRFINFHRWLGRGYLIAVLASGIAGLVMATSSAGGLITDLGFGLLAVFWIVTAIMAYVKIRAGDVESHRRWMVRNYALTYAAVSLRIYLPLSLGVMQYDFNDAYQVIAWACWVPNLLIAEFIFNRNNVARLPTDPQTV